MPATPSNLPPEGDKLRTSLAPSVSLDRSGPAESPNRASAAIANRRQLVHRVRRLPALFRFTIRASGAEAALRIAGWLIGEALRHGLGAVADWGRTPASRLTRRQAREARTLAAGVRILGNLKGAFAKAGQFASLRHDLLPARAHSALSSLRDRVPPLPFSQIRWAVERELGAPLEQLFSGFDATPLGAASIAQVHRATLPNGTPVAVKVQYPWIEASVPADLAILRALLAFGAVARRVSKRLSRGLSAGAASGLGVSGSGVSGLDVGLVYREFARGLADELDFLREAQIAEEIAANLAADDAIVVPSIYHSHTTRRVLTMSLHPTLRLERQELDRAQVDCASVLETLARAYAKQVFVDGLFHADPHSGNLFVIDEPEARTRPRVLFVDFGLSKRLDPALRDNMRRAIYALLQRDTERFVHCMDELGMIAIGAQADVRQAVETMLERISHESGGAGVLGVGGAQVLGLKDDAKALLQETPGLQLPSDLLLYAKTLSYLFALGDELDPDVDLLKLSTPYLLQFLAQKPA